MPLDLLALFLLVHALGVVTMTALAYSGFRSPETRFALVVTFLLIFAMMTLAPLAVVRPTASWLARATSAAPAEWRSCAQTLRHDTLGLRADGHESTLPQGCGQAKASRS